MVPIITNPLKMFRAIDNFLKMVSISAKPSLILIDGYYGAGKTSFSRMLQSFLAQKGVQGFIIPTDYFMRYSRIERMSNMERYLDHPNWYDIIKLSRSVSILLERQPLHLINLYDHKTGELAIDFEIDARNIDCLIVEGMYACNPELMNLCNLSIFLESSHEVLMSRVIVRDMIERSISKEIIQSRYKIINGDLFQRHVDTVVDAIDLVVNTSELPTQVKIRKISTLGKNVCEYLLQDSL